MLLWTCCWKHWLWTAFILWWVIGSDITDKHGYNFWLDNIAQISAITSKMMLLVVPLRVWRCQQFFSWTNCLSTGFPSLKSHFDVVLSILSNISCRCNLCCQRNERPNEFCSFCAPRLNSTVHMYAPFSQYVSLLTACSIVPLLQKWQSEHVQDRSVVSQGEQQENVTQVGEMEENEGQGTALKYYIWIYYTFSDSCQVVCYSHFLQEHGNVVEFAHMLRRHFHDFD